MDNISTALEIMGMGMLGIFTAMVVIMGITYVLNIVDRGRS